MSRKEGANSNPEIQGRLRNREKLAREQRKADLSEVMDLPAGRRFMWSLLFTECGLMNFYPGQDSGIYRHEGARGVGFQLAQELQQHHTEAYVQMIVEHLRGQETEKRLRDAALADKGDDDAS